MKITISIVLSFVLSLVSLSAQDPMVKLTVTGQGADKNEATVNALRSAIEQAYGTFVSSDLSILNDEVVRDEIATVASGNIKRYKELSSTTLGDGSVLVAVEAIVSPQNLVSWSESRGAKVVVSGRMFAMDRQLREINKKNETVVFQNLRHLASVMGPHVFDTEVDFDTYRETEKKGQYVIPITLTFKKNRACEEYMKMVFNTLESVSMSESEVESYRKNQTQYCHIRFYESSEVANNWPSVTAFDCYFRSSLEDISRCLKDVFYKPITSKAIVLDIGDEVKEIPLNLKGPLWPHGLRLEVLGSEYLFYLGRYETDSYRIPEPTREIKLAGYYTEHSLVWPFVSMLPNAMALRCIRDSRNKDMSDIVSAYGHDLEKDVRERERAINGVMAFKVEPKVSESVLFSLESISVQPKGQQVTNGKYAKQEDKGILLYTGQKYINMLGEQVTNTPYDYMNYKVNPPSEGLAIVRRGNKYGYIDKAGKEVIPCIFDRVKPFSEGFASVKQNGRFFFIDKTGTEVLSVDNDGAGVFVNGFCIVSRGYSWGFINKAGKETVPCEYEAVRSFSEGLAAVMKNGRWGFVNDKGEVVIPFKYEEVSDFSNGCSVVSIGSKEYGVIDKTGKEILPCDFYHINKYSDGLASVHGDGGYGYVDSGGNVVIPFIYGSANDFSDGMALVKRQGDWFFIDKTGKKCIGEFNVKPDPFSEGLASVIVDGKYGFIDKSGRMITPFVYDAVGSFSNGYCVVRRGNKNGLIDKSGLEVIPCQYNEIQLLILE